MGMWSRFRRLAASLLVHRRAPDGHAPHVSRGLDAIKRIDSLREAGRYGEAALGPEHFGLAIPLTNLALLKHRQGAFNEAEPFYRRALAISETALGSDHPRVAQIVEQYATLLHQAGRRDEAQALTARGVWASPNTSNEQAPLAALPAFLTVARIVSSRSKSSGVLLGDIARK